MSENDKKAWQVTGLIVVILAAFLVGIWAGKESQKKHQKVNVVQPIVNTNDYGKLLDKCKKGNMKKFVSDGIGKEWYVRCNSKTTVWLIVDNYKEKYSDYYDDYGY